MDSEAVHFSRCVLGLGSQAHLPLAPNRFQLQLYTYGVFLWRVLVIITTNNWDLTSLTATDQDWIKQNCVAVLIDGPVWEVRFANPPVRLPGRFQSPPRSEKRASDFSRSWLGARLASRAPNLASKNKSPQNCVSQSQHVSPPSQAYAHIHTHTHSRNHAHTRTHATGTQAGQHTAPLYNTQ